MQSAVPSWVRGSTVAVYVQMFQGGLVGSVGTSAALVISAILMSGVLLAI
jgi:hypothetical protein